jgi:hypothetical protein
LLRSRSTKVRIEYPSDQKSRFAAEASDGEPEDFSMALGPSDQLFFDFVSKHDLVPWLLALSALGLLAAAKRVLSCLMSGALALLHAFPRLSRAWYDCRRKHAENRRRFEEAKKDGNQPSY